MSHSHTYIIFDLIWRHIFFRQNQSLERKRQATAVNSNHTQCKTTDVLAAVNVPFKPMVIVASIQIEI